MAKSFRYAPVAFVLVLALLSSGGVAPAAKAPAQVRGFVLEVDGAYGASISSVQGCRPVATVVSTQAAASTTKHVAQIAFEPCVVQVQGSMSTALQSWVKETLEGKGTRKGFALHQVDHNRKVTQTTTGQDALIAAVVFPAFDAASKDAATFTLELSAESLRSVSGGGQSSNAPSQGPQKKMLQSSFRVELDGSALPGVVRASPITVRIPIVESAVGTDKFAQKTAAVPVVSDVSLTISASKAEPLTKWADEFIIKGNNDASKEKTLKLVALTPDHKSQLYEVSLAGVGVFGGDLYFSPSAVGDTVPRSTFLLYAESATFTASATWS